MESGPREDAPGLRVRLQCTWHRWALTATGWSGSNWAARGRPGPVRIGRWVSGGRVWGVCMAAPSWLVPRTAGHQVQRPTVEGV